MAIATREKESRLADTPKEVAERLKVSVNSVTLNDIVYGHGGGSK